MTGGMAFIYDKTNDFEKKVNPETVIWQRIETEHWENYLKNLVKRHFEETGSKIAKNILENFDIEKDSFFQVCPKEMLNKLDNPISLKNKVDIAV